jgi:hypothetical protein
VSPSPETKLCDVWAQLAPGSYVCVGSLGVRILDEAAGFTTITYHVALDYGQKAITLPVLPQELTSTDRPVVLAELSDVPAIMRLPAFTLYVGGSPSSPSSPIRRLN